MAHYQICKVCVMDTSDEDIQFDEAGVCNHCKQIKDTINNIQSNYPEERLSELINSIKRQRGKYNCLIGTSGGKDSTYLIVKCIEWGLKPLLVHIDNGWNTEMAVANIKKVTSAFNLDLKTLVLDWSEFKQIQLAFLKSSTVDFEMPTDLAISAGLYRLASKYNIKYIVSAGNYASEGILPLTWGYHVLKDSYYYKTIVKSNSKVGIKNTPLIDLMREVYYKYYKGLKFVYPLNYMNYNPLKITADDIGNIGIQVSSTKHHESCITAFWQSFVMPTKFNYDYRRATFSSLIVAGHLTREDALKQLGTSPYNLEWVEQYKIFIAKKLEISDDELEHFLNMPPKNYKNFPNRKEWISLIHKVYFKFLK